MKQKTRMSWVEVRDRIQGKILDSTYGPGDKLPKDDDIAVEFGCARTTVQRAMRFLSDSGIVERRRKGGTHVRTDPVTRATLDIPITRKEIEQKNGVYGYQLIKVEMAETPLQIAANFNLSSPTIMLHIEAIHLANKRPYIFEDRWVSTETVPEITAIDLSKESANEWLVRNKPYSCCDLRFYAMQATKHFANMLNTDEKEALFVMERTTWTGSKPITSVKAVTMPGYQLLTQIEKIA